MRKRLDLLCLIKPEATVFTRAVSFSCENLKAFSEKLKEHMSSLKFRANKICNSDEMCSSPVHVPAKIISAKGVKQVGNVTTRERGTNATMIVAVNVIGKHVYPKLIFPTVNFKNHILSGALTASVEVLTQHIGQMRGCFLNI